MPVEPPGGSETGSFEQAFLEGTPIEVPCPGLCTPFPCDWIQVTIPSSAVYTCPFSGNVSIGPQNFALRQGDCPAGSSKTGKCWVYDKTFVPPPGTEGTERYFIRVSCDTENLSHPVLEFRYDNSLRNTGDPDPEIHVCFGPVCMTTTICDCLPAMPQFLGRIGFGHGENRIFLSDIIGSPTNNCRCQFNGAPGDEITVKCLCGNSNCCGTPRNLHAEWKCDGVCDCLGAPICPDNQADCEAASFDWIPGFGTLVFDLEWKSVADMTAEDNILGLEPPYAYWVGRTGLSGSCSLVMARVCGVAGVSILIELQGDEGDPCLAYWENLFTTICGCGSATPVAPQNCEPFLETYQCSGPGAVSFITVTGS